ncbi:MAG TPA: regulatory protein RecX [Gammaproteobacteria bacterium]|jgi:regulatory protein|nr:regulatory protein RecX [Gammaproteobacteria bacterium]
MMNTPPNDTNKLLEKIRRHALYLLTRRDHTCLELKQKLSRKGYDDAHIVSIIASLEEAGLINAARFTESYTHYRRGKGYGPRRIAMELQAKGVAESVIAEHVKIADNAWFTEIRIVWRKQFKCRLPEDARDRAKQMRFLYNRGFTQEQIKSVFEDE